VRHEVRRLSPEAFDAALAAAPHLDALGPLRPALGPARGGAALLADAVCPCSLSPYCGFVLMLLSRERERGREREREREREERERERERGERERRERGEEREREREEREREREMYIYRERVRRERGEREERERERVYTLVLILYTVRPRSPGRLRLDAIVSIFSTSRLVVSMPRTETGAPPFAASIPTSGPHSPCAADAACPRSLP
jgi:hypothetical protein